MDKITSTDNKLIKQLYKLKNKKNSIEEELFLIEGTNVINEAISAGIVKQILYTKDQFSFKNKLEVSENIMKKLSSLTSNQGAIAVCEYLKHKIKSTNRIIILDGVNIPNNVGAVIRTALAFNFDGIVLSNDSAHMYNPKTIFSSQGAIFKIPTIQTNIEKYIKDNNFKTYASTLTNDSISMDDIEVSENMCFIMGSETNGISRKIFEISDEKFKIEMNNIDSLNIAVAAGIIINKFKK